MPDVPASPDHARLWLPPLSLGGCVHSAMLCDTRSAFEPGRARINCFPATPLVSLIWWLQGGADFALGMPAHGRVGEFDGEPVPGPLTLAGPLPAPSRSRTVGPVHVLQLMLLPDAFHALTGLAPAALVGRMVDAREVLPRAWRDWAAGVAAADDDEARFALIEAFLQPRWRGTARPAAQRYREWAEALALQAATSGPGRSLRALERRIKRSAGLPLREIQAMARGEAAFFAGAEGERTGTLRWAELALEHGYADQSHLCRASRRLCGFSPAELAQRIRHDEAFWPYRLWL